MTVLYRHILLNTLQTTGKNTSDKPMLIRIDKNSGHGAGKSTEKLIDEEADKFVFLFNNIK